MDLQLTGKVVLVAAASKGLGKAAAKAFAEEGAKVAICSRSSQIEETAHEIRQETNADILAVRADVTNQRDIAHFVKMAFESFAQIDILVLNAGGPNPGDFTDLTPEDWEAGINLTLMSAVRLCYAVVPIMLQRGSGSIVAIESISVKQPIGNLILSNAIRMSVIGLLKSMANELGPNGIRINSINPTFTRTERVEKLLADRADINGTTVDEELAKAMINIPLGRMGEPEEFGRAVAWLASPAAAFIHGHALMFDGGATNFPL